MAKFEREVDPDGVLLPDERARRAEHARKAHFARLSLRSAKSRRRARELSEDAAQADAELAALRGGSVVPETHSPDGGRAA
jgi:hypothetical protein